jgi:hypothetical protein
MNHHPQRRPRWPWIITLIALLIAVAGTALYLNPAWFTVKSSSPLASLPFMHVVDGYLQTDSEDVRYLTWVENNGQITGSWSTTYINPQTHKPLSTDGSLTGTHVGDAISVEIEYGLGQHLTGTGTLDNNMLTLEINSVLSGTITQYTFQGVPESAYEQALADFRTTHP